MRSYLTCCFISKIFNKSMHAATLCYEIGYFLNVNFLRDRQKTVLFQRKLYD